MRTLLRNFLRKKALKIRLEGPIDMKKQQNILRAIARGRNEADGILMIINSYGGSLAIAKNIAFSLQRLKKQQIPVYCFAQQYCLNSANLILASGSLCFANKLSVLGDIGYAQQKYTFSHHVGVESIASGNRPFQLLGNRFGLNQTQEIQKVIEENASDLRKAILEFRQGKIKYDKEILQGGTLSPRIAEEIGLVDGLQNCNKFVRTTLQGWKILEGGQQTQYRATNFFRNGLQVFKQQ